MSTLGQAKYIGPKYKKRLPYQSPKYKRKEIRELVYKSRKYHSPIYGERLYKPRKYHPPQGTIVVPEETTVAKE